MLSASGSTAAQERSAAAWVAGTLLTDPQCVAVRVLRPRAVSASAAQAGLCDVLYRVEAETATGRRFFLTVVLDEVPVVGSVSDVPAWTLPGTFGDALANPDPRWWVALVIGRGAPVRMLVARDYAIRRLVMDRHLEAARSGVIVSLADDSVTLDLGLDLATRPGAFVFLEDVLAEVEADALRPDDPAVALASRPSLAPGRA